MKSKALVYGLGGVAYQLAFIGVYILTVRKFRFMPQYEQGLLDIGFVVLIFLIPSIFYMIVGTRLFVKQNRVGAGLTILGLALLSSFLTVSFTRMFYVQMNLPFYY
jgi:hypothetical protein